MKFRRHHNNKGYRQIKRGRTVDQVRRIARKMRVPFGIKHQMPKVRDYRWRLARLYYWKPSFWWFRVSGYGLHVMRRTSGKWEIKFLRPAA